MHVYKSHISKFLENKYSVIYYQIIDRALTEDRKKTNFKSNTYTYYELHHILPRSIYREFVNLRKHKWNGVLLTAREHFICHKLLVRMASTDRTKAQMLHAVMYLITAPKDNTLRITSREYEYYRVQAALAHSLLITGKYSGQHSSTYGKKWYSNLTTGQSMQYFPSEVPEGWVLGRNAFTNTNNSVGGTKWYHNPTTGENGMYNVGSEPEGWIKGRGEISSKGKAAYYNPQTGETRRFKSGEEPTGWLPGNYTLRCGTYDENRCNNISKGLRSSTKIKRTKVMCDGIIYESIREAIRKLGWSVRDKIFSDKFPNYYIL